VGADEARALALAEATSEIPPLVTLKSNLRPYQGEGHCLVGSLTGAVASQNVTEAYEGHLSLIGNQAVSALA
jgi:hypothetical protein